jgi:hypothetical protein
VDAGCVPCGCSRPSDMLFTGRDSRELGAIYGYVAAVRITFRGRRRGARTSALQPCVVKLVTFVDQPAGILGAVYTGGREAPGGGDRIVSRRRTPRAHGQPTLMAMAN